VVDYKDVLASLAKISPENPEGNCPLFGERFNRAWGLVKEDRVKKYSFRPSGKIVWIVIGRKREYLIHDKVGYCSCDDFYFQVMEGRALVCSHLIAQRLAESLNWYDVIEEGDWLFDTLMEEWKNHQPISREASKIV